MVHGKRAVAVVMLIAFVGLAVFAEATGGPVIPGQPPLSKTVVVGALTKDPDLVQSTRPVTMGREIVISGPGMTVPQETYDVLMRGGNFFDASIPLMWTTMWAGNQFFGQTAQPSMYNAKEKRATAHLGMGTNPALIDLNLVRNVLKLQFPPNEADMGGVGAWIRAGVLPAPDTMTAVLDRYGSMTWKQATKGIYEMGLDGIPSYGGFVNTSRSMFSNKAQMSLPIYVETRAYWGQNGPNPKEGALLKRPGVSRLIGEMADAEAAALAAGKSRSEALTAARNEFYMGGFAKAIDQFSRDTGGYTRWSDYAAYKGEWVEQETMIHTTFMGIDFYADSPVSQGPALIMVLNMIEAAKEVLGKSLFEMGYWTPDYISFLTSCFSLQASDRFYWFADPRFVDIPAQLFTKEYAIERVKLIDLKKAFQRMPPPGDPRNMKGTLPGYKEWTLPPKVAGAPAQTQDLAMIPDEQVTDTTHAGMIDAAGNIFTYTPSDPGPLVPGYGIGIGARNRQFVYDPAIPNVIAPGKRPVTTPNTWVAVKDGEGYLETQTPGGDDQVPAAIQTLMCYLLWGMNPQTAAEQPKFTTNNQISWFTPHIEGYYSPGEIELPRGVPALMVTAQGATAFPPKATVDELTARGNKVTITNYPGIGSGMTMTVRDPKTHVILGGTMAYAGQNHISWGR
jgi:gamma-glutamyltranspeptidase/glutathione hydrolase